MAESKVASMDMKRAVVKVTLKAVSMAVAMDC